MIRYISILSPDKPLFFNENIFSFHILIKLKIRNIVILLYCYLAGGSLSYWLDSCITCKSIYQCNYAKPQHISHITISNNTKCNNMIYLNKIEQYIICLYNVYILYFFKAIIRKCLTESFGPLRFGYFIRRIGRLLTLLMTLELKSGVVFQKKWKLSSLSLTSLGNNADKDGTTTSILPSIKPLGLFKKKNYYFKNNKILETNGQKFLRFSKGGIYSFKKNWQLC